MKLYVVKERTYSATRTYEVEVPDEVMAAQDAQRQLGHGPMPLDDFIEQAERSGQILNDHDPFIPDEAQIECISTDYSVFDHDCSRHNQYHHPISTWDY